MYCVSIRVESYVTGERVALSPSFHSCFICSAKSGIEISLVRVSHLPRLHYSLSLNSPSLRTWHCSQGKNYEGKSNSSLKFRSLEDFKQVSKTSVSISRKEIRRTHKDFCSRCFLANVDSACPYQALEEVKSKKFCYIGTLPRFSRTGPGINRGSGGSIEEEPLGRQFIASQPLPKVTKYCVSTHGQKRQAPTAAAAGSRET